MALSFAFRRTLSLTFILAILTGIWLSSTHQTHGLQYVHSVLGSYYPASSSFPHGSDPTRGYWTQNTDHKLDSRVWKSGECYDTTSELKNGQPIPGGFLDDGSRAEAVDSWEWVMEGGVRLRDWDMDGFIARALQSRVGVFVVGGMYNHHCNICTTNIMNTAIVIFDVSLYRLHQQSDLYRAHPYAQHARSIQTSCTPGNLWQRPCQLYDRLTGPLSQPHPQPEPGNLQTPAAARRPRAHTRRTMDTARRALLPLRHAHSLLRARSDRRGERRKDDDRAVEEGPEDPV